MRHKLTINPKRKELLNNIKKKPCFRRLKTLNEKVEYLQTKHQFSREELIAAKFVTRWSFRRHMMAVKEGRKPGITGRPPYIPKEVSESVLDDFAKMADSGNGQRVKRIHAEVCIYLLPFFFIINDFQASTSYKEGRPQN